MDISVMDAVWVATAMMAAKKYTEDPDVKREDLFFKQSEIVKRAQTLTTSNVDPARVSMWGNADNKNSTHNYLRADLAEDPSARRLSLTDEFTDKTYPTDIDKDELFEIDGLKLTMEELLFFAKEQYPEVMIKMQNVDIDYKGVLDYLANNQELPYSNPEADGISVEDKNRYLAVKEKGQAVVAEMAKMASRCEELFGLDKCLPIKWLDGSNTKTRKYLWAQMKYKDYVDNPASVSLFVEKNNGVTRYRISLEIKNDGTDKKTMALYHSHLDIPKEDGMVYVSGSNEWGNPAIINDSVEDIKKKIAANELRKVQLCIYVDSSADKTNEQYDADVMDAVKRIIPYYEHVIEKDASSGRAWLLTWNPESWTWKDYAEWCADTKIGKKHVEPWTCASKQPAVGDEVFLIKTGAKPRGILAHGHVHKAAYETDHYDPEKAAQGVKANHIDAEFDWIQDFNSEPMLMQDIIKEKLPDQQWSPMGSGIEIKASVLPELKKMWNELIGKDKEEIVYWPSLEEYDPGMTKDMWLQAFHDRSVTTDENLFLLKCMLELGGESTCANLAEKYGKTAAFYNRTGSSFGEKVAKKFGLSPYEEDGQKRYFVIPFVGRYVQEGGKRRYSWKLRTELEEALKEMDLSHIDITIAEDPEVTFDKNMILYGPPGTGKTYSTAIYAVAICDELEIDRVKEMDYDDVMIRYRELLSSGRIAFTTFHQSYGYEEFIEGIKPVLNGGDNIGYTIEDGVFKSFCKGATMPEGNDIDHNAKVWKVVLKSGDLVSNNTIKFECFNEGKIMYDWKTREEHAGTYASSQIAHFQERVNIGDIVVSYAGSGTDIDAVGIVTGDAVYDENMPSFRWSRSVRWIEINKVHNISELNAGKYFDNDSLQQLKRVNIAELLKLVEPQNRVSSNKNYVFVIDEINRGNISKIFGELITLIEETKREGMDEQASAILPYSGEAFSVPSNVYILGTMNTADRSIALMDTALRRRFQFVEMMPDADVLRDIGADKVDDLDVALMLEKINERITFLFDREHTIGHAFFTKLAKKPTIETLRSIFEKSVIPLLQEYFYEDYQKIQLVLGDNGKSDPDTKFILDEEVKVKNIFKGNAEDVIDLPDKKYTINADAFDNLESYKQII
ncbi:MAG: AAA family ATPase [Erysipelotrichaceae bacterium]|nr:AAA family ATPase [Erysipelotrichaceae bacterium]